jgi:5-methylcytosine-specific restriction endonuclease McrA
MVFTFTSAAAAHSTPTFHVPFWVWLLAAGVIALSAFDRRLRAQRKAKHRAYLRSAAWRQRRREALEAANNRCLDCGSAERLHVRHLTYKRWGNEHPHNLRVLCSRCHRRRHGRNGAGLDDVLDRVLNKLFNENR